jgi:hypothetical protein
VRDEAETDSDVAATKFDEQKETSNIPSKHHYGDEEIDKPKLTASPPKQNLLKKVLKFAFPVYILREDR